MTLFFDRKAVFTTLVISIISFSSLVSAHTTSPVRSHQHFEYLSAITVLLLGDDMSTIEPDLNILKSVTPTIADAGDVLTYTIQVTHDPLSTGPAYDLIVTDQLPMNLVLSNSSVSTSLGSVTAGGAMGDSSIRIDIPALDIGQSATITFQATLSDNTLFNSTVVNTASLIYDNDPNDGAADEQTYGPETSDATISTPSPTVTKSVFESSVVATEGSELIVGETVTFRINIDVPEGFSPMTLVDTLPDMGTTLSFVEGRIISQTENISFSAAPTISNFGAFTIFDFKTVTVDGSDGGTGGQIVLELDALVEDLPPGEADGATLTNQVDLNFSGGLAEAEATVTIIIEP